MASSAANASSLILSGFLNNLLMTVLAALLPLGLGIGMTFLMKHVDKKGLRIPLRVVGAVFYSFAPVALLLYLFFSVIRSVSGGGILPVVLTLMISHLGYFMMRFEPDASVGKNIVVNTLGLFSSLFMWSMIAGYIGCHDMVYASNMVRSLTFDAGITLTVLAIAFGMLAVLNVPRMILKETMR